MLIRIASHSKDNPLHVDKMIDITGVPQDWFFYKKDGKKFLKAPWQFDIDRNIPIDIRLKFQPEPMTIWTETPTEQRPGVSDPTMPRWLVDEHKVYGLRIDYQTGPGKEMWDQIEELLERETPRSLRVPQPKKVGDRMNWTLLADQLPSVKLTGDEEVFEQPAQEPVKLETKPEPRPEEFACRDCGNVYKKQRALWMHRRKAHKSAESMKQVGATV